MLSRGERDAITGSAELLCGPEARHRIFEPLVADWQREWLDANTAWIVTPFAYHALFHCSIYLAILASLPRAMTPWIAPAMFATMATVMLIAKWGGTKVPPSARA